MPQLTIIGIGSPFADDMAGWSVADALSCSGLIASYGGRVTVAICRSPASELLSLLADTDIAIVVDAVCYGGAPGTVYRLSSLQSSSSVTEFLSSHGLDLQTLFTLADTLEISPKMMVIYGIEAGPDNRNTKLSQGVQRAVVRVTDDIKRDIEHYCGEARPKPWFSDM